MDAKTVIYGETALDRLAQWLRSTGQPQDIRAVMEQYLDLLRQLVVEEENND
jgi:predicted RNA-binding protein with PUA domain